MPKQRYCLSCPNSQQLVISSAAPQSIFESQTISSAKSRNPEDERSLNAARRHLRGTVWSFSLISLVKGMERMKFLFMTTALIVAGLFTVVSGQSRESEFKDPKEVVESLWKMATTGELLTKEGWNRASRLFAASDQPFSNKTITVVSNYYGADRPIIQGTTANIVVWYGGTAGQIDSSLRFRPAPATNTAKSLFPYTLVLAASHFTIFDQDGKTVIKEMTGSPEWQISSPRQPSWVTVNSAIRYVLEMRSKTHNRAIQRNADETIKALLHYE